MKVLSSSLVLLGLMIPSPAHAGPPSLPPAAEAAKLQVILLGYTSKDGVGRACQKDLVAVKKMLLDSFNSPDLRPRLAIHDLTGDLWSGHGILEYIRTMTIGRDDVVLAYHSGHGGDMIPGRPEETHLLNLNRGGISRVRLRQALWLHQPRGLILLTDCCSAWVKGLRGVSLEADPWPRRGPNWATLRNLLLRTPKLVDITAAEDGRMAQAAHLTHKGTGAESAFTVALLTLLHSPHEFHSWSELYPYLKQYTREASGGTHQPRYFQLLENHLEPLPAAPQAASADLEYFCPMHPTIIRDNSKEKCPICFMPLSKRKKETFPNRPTADAELFNRLTGGIVPPPLVAPTAARHLENRLNPDPDLFHRIR